MNEYIEHTLVCLGFPLWIVWKMTGRWVVVGWSQWRNCAIPPTGLEPLPHTSVAPTAHYLNVCQRKLGTIIIQTVHILQHESADTGSLPMEDFFKHNPTYFQLTLPGMQYGYTSVPRRRKGMEFFLDCYCCFPQTQAGDSAGWPAQPRPLLRYWPLPKQLLLRKFIVIQIIKKSKRLFLYFPKQNFLVTLD